MFLVKILGLDRLTITVDPGAPGPYPVYHLDRLTDGEIELLDSLSTKMLMGPPEE